MNERTGLDCPSVRATASKAPPDPAGSEPAQPGGRLARRFQLIVSTWGTPWVNRTDRSAESLHAAESQTTRPCRVTTTCTEAGP